MNSSVLVISDLHIPYHHQDAFEFLKALKKKYKPDLIVNIGDELDHHAISMHEHNPDLMSAGDELKQSKEYVRDLEKIFPRMTLVHSNHSSLVYRRALKYGLPKDYLKSYNEFLGVGDGWKWVDDLTVTLSDNSRCFFTHGMSADVLKVAQQYGMNTVQGHYHTKFCIGYYSNPDALVWGMQVGCLINQKSMAFDYAKNFKSRFIVGCGMIIDGQPKLMPMVLDKDGRWNKMIP
ncbi:MAG: metallophosphoesterase [Minisyncoccia bacterium]